MNPRATAPACLVGVTPATVSSAVSGVRGTALPKLTLALGYVPSVQFAPFYVAAEKGYYRQAGLDVQFQHGIVPDLLKLVGSGKLNYAVASGDEMLVARSQGVPLVYIAAWYQKYPIVLITKQGSGITKIQELKGKSVGVPGPYGATYTGLLALLHSAGMSQSDVHIRSIGFTQVQALQQGKVDAVMGYANNEPIQLQQLGVKISTIPVWQHTDLVSNGIVTNEQTLAANRGQEAALVRATMQGIAYTIAHPDEAFDLSLKYVPEAASDRAVQLQVLKASLPLWQSDATEQHGLGYTSPASWRSTLDFLEATGAITGSVDLSKAYTNDFVTR